MIGQIAVKFRTGLFAWVLACFLLPPGVAYAGSAAEIDASVDAALGSFKKEVKGANDYLAAAKGVIVMPDVKKVGFVVGAQWGEGALRVGGKTVDYDKMEAASAGFQGAIRRRASCFCS